MSSSPVRVFLHGKGTFTRWDFGSQGKYKGTIQRPGAGRFLDPTFASVAEAKQFCEGELCKNRADIFYLMQDELIVETVMDSAYLTAKDRKSLIVWNIGIAIVVALVLLLIFLVMSPFQSRSANLAMAVGMELVYLFMLWVNNWNFVESMVAFVIFLACALLMISAVKKARARREHRNKPVASLTFHASRFASVTLSASTGERD